MVKDPLFNTFGRFSNFGFGSSFVDTGYGLNDRKSKALDLVG
jgi:hypothetical protein